MHLCFPSTEYCIILFRGTFDGFNFISRVTHKVTHVIIPLLTISKENATGLEKVGTNLLLFLRVHAMNVPGIRSSKTSHSHGTNG